MLTWNKRDLGDAKNDIFDILLTITMEVNIIARQMTPFFSTTLRALSAGIFYFSRHNSIRYVPTFELRSGLWNKCMPNITLSSLLTLILRFWIKLSFFWYKICLLPKLFALVDFSHGLVHNMKLIINFSKE